MTDTNIRAYTSEQEVERDEETEETARSEEQEQCPECGGRLISDAEHAETVCDDCGLVVEEDGIDRGLSGAHSTPQRKTRKAASAPQRRT